MKTNSENNKKEKERRAWSTLIASERQTGREEEFKNDGLKEVRNVERFN